MSRDEVSHVRVAYTLQFQAPKKEVTEGVLVRFPSSKVQPSGYQDDRILVSVELEHPSDLAQLASFAVGIRDAQPSLLIDIHSSSDSEIVSVPQEFLYLAYDIQATITFSITAEFIPETYRP